MVVSVDSNGRKDDANLKIDGPALTVISRLSRWEFLGLLLLPIALWGLWHLWSLAGLLEAIPYLGPLLAAVGPVSMALTQSPLRAVIVLVFFTALQQIEDKMVVPQLQSHTTGLHPLTVILATLMLGSLFGLMGMVAVPLAAAGQAVLVCVTSCFYPGPLHDAGGPDRRGFLQPANAGPIGRATGH